MALRLQNNKRPAFQPPAEVTPKSLDDKFEELEKSEAESSTVLHAELARQIRLHNLAKRVRSDAEKLRSLLQEKENYANKQEAVDSVESAEQHVDNAAANITETQHLKTSRLSELKKIAAELYKEKFEEQDNIRQVESQVEDYANDVVSKSENKKKTLEQELAKQLAINDALCKDFAEVVKCKKTASATIFIHIFIAFSDWLNIKKYHLSSSNAELEKQLEDLVKSTADNSEASAKLEAILQIDAKIKARQITNNKYTNVTAQDCSAQWAQFELLIKKKKELLESQIEEKKKAGLSDDQVEEIKKTFEYFDRVSVLSSSLTCLLGF